MREGPIKEPSYYFPGEEIKKYMDILPEFGLIEDMVVEDLGSCIVILTHDDKFDSDMYAIEKDNGFSSTWFMDMTDPYWSYDTRAKDDIEIHFNKEISTLKLQIERFTKRFGRPPKYNRNHRLLMRSPNLDFPFLAMNGIKVDSTYIGTKPYYPTINGKSIPILELPFCITDAPTRTMCAYNVAKHIEDPFNKKQPIIVVNAHPFEVCELYGMKSCYYEVIRNANKYGYQIISIDDFIGDIS